MSFRVDLDLFRGPLDLLLYLVRKHELDITDIPMAMVTEQFLQHLDVLKELDVDAVHVELVIKIEVDAVATIVGRPVVLDRNGVSQV